MREIRTSKGLFLNAYKYFRSAKQFWVKAGVANWEGGSLQSYHEVVRFPLPAPIYPNGKGH
jgi:hypothetical protein